jgi:hypothetical protein
MIFLVGVLCVAAVVQHVARRSRSTVAVHANTAATGIGWTAVVLLAVIVLIIVVASAA